MALKADLSTKVKAKNLWKTEIFEISANLESYRKDITQMASIGFEPDFCFDFLDAIDESCQSYSGL